MESYLGSTLSRTQLNLYQPNTFLPKQKIYTVRNFNFQSFLQTLLEKLESLSNTFWKNVDKKYSNTSPIYFEKKGDKMKIN